MRTTRKLAGDERLVRTISKLAAVAALFATLSSTGCMISGKVCENLDRGHMDPAANVAAKAVLLPVTIPLDLALTPIEVPLYIGSGEWARAFPTPTH
jgi:hypothetical protein